MSEAWRFLLSSFPTFPSWHNWPGLLKLNTGCLKQKHSVPLPPHAQRTRWSDPAQVLVLQPMSIQRKQFGLRAWASGLPKSTFGHSTGKQATLRFQKKKKNESWQKTESDRSLSRGGEWGGKSLYIPTDYVSLIYIRTHMPRMGKKELLNSDPSAETTEHTRDTLSTLKESS